MPLLDDLSALLDGRVERCAIPCIPYVAFLGVEAFRSRETGGIDFVMPYSEHLIGTPKPPRLHGGAVGALLELAGSFAVILAARGKHGGALMGLPKPIGITVEFMRGGAPDEMFARGEVLRLGRRVANVRATAWQGSDPSRISASANMHFLMPQA